MVAPVIVDEKRVREILTPQILIDLMREALKKSASGQVVQPPRTIHKLPQDILFGFMAGYLGDDDYFGAKVVTAVPANEGTEYPSHLGSVLVFDSQHGVLRGIIDATSVTELRTSAVSAVATDLLARKDSHTLAVIGAGAQARGHIAAITTIRDITQIRIYSRNTCRAQALKEETEAAYHIPTIVCADVREAVENADIICTVTASKQPLLCREWVAAGTHINAVGAFSPTTREVTSDLVAASSLYADEVAAMKRECGEYLIPVSEGLIDESHIRGCIGDLLLGKITGRESDEEITLFDSLGLACEDMETAKYVYLQCREDQQ